jgi:hypothetical protein
LPRSARVLCRSAAGATWRQRLAQATNMHLGRGQAAAGLYFIVLLLAAAR